jgi:hypothetical protein
VARVPRRDPVAAIWKMAVTLRNQHGVGCRQSAPDASSSSDRVLAWLRPVSGIVPSREVSPEASRSRRLRDPPISCRRKAPTAMRNAAHTRSGGVSTARSLSTGLTPFSPRGLRRPGGGRSGRRLPAAAPPATTPALWLARPARPQARRESPRRLTPLRASAATAVPWPARRGRPPPARRAAALQAFWPTAPRARSATRRGWQMIRTDHARWPQRRRDVGPAWQDRMGQEGRH